MPTCRISTGGDIFILAILTSAAMAWISAGYQAVVASLANSVKSLSGGRADPASHSFRKKYTASTLIEISY
ncbi:hypothetical protein [Mucilaginibacter gossypii]|uniref:hypothetical protein n=1 Tax=Mucilaginibacter gossypii TaxID=551996 RepID=UPI000B82920E|nr:hypothetical protein [Mucilaginibacter gossypii]